MSPRPDELRTDRLRLRPLRASDADALHPAFADPENLRWWHRTPSPSLEVTRQRLEEAAAGGGVFAICRHETDVAIGHVGFVGEVRAGESAGFGYFLARDHWGHGYVVEAARPVLAHGFDELGATAAELWIYEGNHQSIRVAEKLGATLVGQPTFVNVERGIWPKGRVYLVTSDRYVPPLQAIRATARLRVPDVAAAVEWFDRALGWKPDFVVGSPPVSAQVASPGYLPEVALIRLAVGDPGPGEVTVMVPAGLDELAARAGDSVVQAPVDRPWGMRECVLRDPWGNTIVLEGPTEGSGGT